MPASPEKYFREPGGSRDLSHYDARFFSGHVPYGEPRRAVLRALARSYLEAAGAAGVETWLAHGTLLGWWWGGAVMPWDDDLDAQVSSHTLAWMARHLNGTEHAVNVSVPLASATAAAAAADSGGRSRASPLLLQERIYLLDVNPYHAETGPGDAANVIDARWIDTENGMFVDITAVRQRDGDGLWSCKNHHRYAGRDLWPLRTTEFEGVEAQVPYSVENILRQEYGDASLVLEEFEG